MTTAARRIAEWASALRLDDIPADVRHAAALHLLDGFGVALAAAQRAEGAFASKVARTMPSPREATILGSADRVPAPMAALANGVLIHVLDYDDTHARALVHPTSVVAPTAFACAEERGATGADVIAAVVAGYEILVRLGAAAPHAFHARGLHATSVCGVFAAALVAANLYALDVASTVQALGIAGSQASGSLEFLNTGSSTKQLHPGWAAHAGVMAARLAAAGATGPDSILEGALGFYRAYADAAVDPTSLTAGLGTRWETLGIGIKPYPACQLSHASLDALASLGAKLESARPVRISFDVPRDAVPIVCEPAEGKRRPRTPYEAKFSLPWSAAALLVDGALSLSTFDVLERPDVESVADLVAYRATDPGVAAAEADGSVSVDLRDGATLTASVRGGGCSATEDAIIRKLRSHGLTGADELADAILALERAPDLTRVLAAAR